MTERSIRPHAHMAVLNAIRTGALTRPATCSECGKLPTGKSKIHGHHRDYLKPLEVVWLCTKCHRSATPGINGGPPDKLNARLPDDLRDRIDALRGDVPRERFIRRLLQSALDQREKES